MIMLLCHKNMKLVYTEFLKASEASFEAFEINLLSVNADFRRAAKNSQISMASSSAPGLSLEQYK